MLLAEYDSEFGAYFITVAMRSLFLLLEQHVKVLYSVGCVYSCVFSEQYQHCSGTC